MTLDKAIKDFTDSAKELKYEANYWRDKGDSKSLEDTLKVAEYNEQLAEWLTELKETRKLLKQAVEDFSGMDNHIYSCDRLCDDCPLSGERDHCLKWRYADEAMKLLKEG